MDHDTQLSSFIDRYSPDIAADLRRALQFLQRRLPSASRLIYDNYNALVIAFASSDKVGDVILSIAAYPRYVTLFFAKGVDLPDPQGLLEGSGSVVRSIRLQPISRLESMDVAKLIDAAVEKGPRLPASGAGPLIIKSISAKQRPRRPA